MADKEAAAAVTLKDRFEKLEKLFTIRPTLLEDKSISCELLIDLLIAVYTDIQRNTRNNRDKNSSTFKFVEFVKPLVERVNQLQLKSNDFEQLKIIGKGAFGQVSLVKCKESQHIFAMKVLNKLEMAKRAEKACYREERDILLHGSKEWFTRLHYSFQDADNLYLVMDYYIGGDFLTLLSKYDDTLPEDMCRFYAAQMILAISALHDMGFIHRDIKPHNILIDSSGHIRLADFGSCVKASTVKFDTSTPVGTPDYISPEILTVIEGKPSHDIPYSYETDWWSLGIVIFESFYGETPFYAESLVETYYKIMNHYKFHFKFPVNAQVTDEAKDLISNLITDRSSRYKTIDQFRSHPWFTGIDWEQVRYQEPPYRPAFTGPEDTSNFDTSDIKPINNNPIAAIAGKQDANLELSFVGFTATFTSEAATDEDKSLQSAILQSLKLDDNAEDSSVSSATAAAAAKAPAEPSPSSAKALAESSPPSSPALSSPVPSPAPSPLMDADTKAQISLLESRLKAATQEWSEMSVLLTEIKKEKNTLSDKLRVKEEELDEQIEKNSQLRVQIRSCEKTKRGHLEEIANLQTEVNTMKIGRKQDQSSLKELQDKLELLERQLQVDTESSKMLSNEKTLFLKRVADLEAQVLTLEEENEGLKGECAQARQWAQRLTGQVQAIGEQSVQCEVELKDLAAIITEEQQHRTQMEQMVEALEFSVKRYRRYNEQGVQTNTNTDIATNSSNGGSGGSTNNNSGENVIPNSAQELSSATGTLSKNDSGAAGGGTGTINPNHNNPASWQERRSVREDKQKLHMLQVQVNIEVAEKQKIQSELTKLQQDFDSLLFQLNESKGEVARLKKQQQQAKTSGSNLALSTGGDTSVGGVRSSDHNESDSDQYRGNSLLNEYLMLEKSGGGGGGSRSSSALLQQHSSALSNHSNYGSNSKRQSLIGGGGGAHQQQHYELSTATTGSTSQDNFDYHNKFGHSFIIRTFITPLKCYICTSLMIGLVRQGYVCEVCGYACHVGCVDLGSPCPFDESKQRPVGIDPQKGVGTAYEGYVKIPKPKGGVRKGWVRMYVVVCDFKLFLYDIMNAGEAQSAGLNYSALPNIDPLINPPSISANTIIDMRDEHFSVSDVTESDVIHASPKDIPCIFRITTSMIGGPEGDGRQIFTQLMLVDKESEKRKWIDALQELHRIIRRNKIPHRNILRNYHLLNMVQMNALRHINNVYCCTLIDETRLLIGCDDSMICCDLDIHAYHRLSSSKRFYAIVYVQSEQLIVALSGKQRAIKLIPIRALDNENIEWIKIAESKNATTFTVAYDSGVAYVAVAVRKTLHIFEITRKKARYAPHREIQMPVNIQTLNSCRGNLIAVGTSSNFIVYHVNRSETPLYLVNQESPDLIYLIQNTIDPLLCVPIDDNEWLLIFAHYGVYVDNHGKRTRSVELQYPSQPCYASVLRSSSHNSATTTTTYLLIFSLTHIDVFNVEQTKWVQTINLKATKPLQTFGDNILFCVTDALDMPNILQIVVDSDSKIKVRGDNIKAFTIKNLNQKNVSSQVNELKKNTKIQISAPTDFSHISHLGPGVGPFSANLIDLNNLKDTMQRPPSKESMTKSHSSLHYSKN